MSETVIVALITGGAGVVCSIITGLIASGKTIYRIGLLEKKVEKHNSLVERMTAVETKVAFLEKEAG
jgi:hypothetical protein